MARTSFAVPARRLSLMRRSIDGCEGKSNSAMRLMYGKREKRRCPRRQLSAHLVHDGIAQNGQLSAKSQAVGSKRRPQQLCLRSVVATHSMTSPSRARMIGRFASPDEWCPRMSRDRRGNRTQEVDGSSPFSSTTSMFSAITTCRRGRSFCFPNSHR